jgi:cytochrome c oxidase subunit 3
MESASVALGGGPHTDTPEGGTGEHHEHHGPPTANKSSRVDPQFLGMLLFIISEVMLFGAFFTAYFFIRVVNGDAWPAQGEELPKIIAGINTAVLISSSFTMHWALEGARNENRRALRVGMLTTFFLGLTFLCVQINEYVHIGFAPSDNAQGTIFYGLTGLHGAHVFVGLTLLLMATIRSYRGHFSSKEHRGIEVPGIYWHFVDVMWIVVYTTVYII